MSESLIDKLRLAAKCVYIVLDEDVADDLSSLLNKAADRILELELRESLKEVVE